MRPPAKFEGNRYSIIGTAVVIGSLIPLAQYSFRRFDDNNYTSWDWIFRIINPGNYALALISALLLVAIAFSAFRFTLPSRLRNTALFSACFIAASVLWITPEVNIDTSRYFMEAKHLEQYGITYFFREWGKGIPAWTDLPAVPFLHGLLFTMFGESRMAVQIFTASLFAMTAVLTSLIGKTLWDEDTGFYAGALLLGMPYLLSQTPLMLVDVPTMFFLMLSIYLFIRILEGGRDVAGGGCCMLCFFDRLLQVFDLADAVRIAAHRYRLLGQKRRAVTAANHSAEASLRFWHLFFSLALPARSNTMLSPTSSTCL